MVIAVHNFRGHVNVLIYTVCEVAGGMGGGGGVFGFWATQVQKETDVLCCRLCRPAV